ncbi:hypothetical protein A2U01_0027077, partial [Trifolium medium]|nr:hypothetical protein [Trifolium medium]
MALASNRWIRPTVLINGAQILAGSAFMNNFWKDCGEETLLVNIVRLRALWRGTSPRFSVSWDSREHAKGSVSRNLSLWN